MPNAASRLLRHHKNLTPDHIFRMVNCQYMGKEWDLQVKSSVSMRPETMGQLSTPSRGAACTSPISDHPVYLAEGVEPPWSTFRVLQEGSATDEQPGQRPYGSLQIYLGL